MSEMYGLYVVGGGSFRVRDAARLSERPPILSGGPCGSRRQTSGHALDASGGGEACKLDPTVDWMYTADPGNRGSRVGRQCLMPVRAARCWEALPRELMAYVRGHPGDFDALGRRWRHWLEL